MAQLEQLGARSREAEERGEELGEELGEEDREMLHSIKEQLGEPGGWLDAVKEHLNDPGLDRYFALVEAWNACPEKFRKTFVGKIVSCNPIKLGSSLELVRNGG